MDGDILDGVVVVVLVLLCRPLLLCVRTAFVDSKEYIMGIFPPNEIYICSWGRLEKDAREPLRDGVRMCICMCRAEGELCGSGFLPFVSPAISPPRCAFSAAASSTKKLHTTRRMYIKK